MSIEEYREKLKARECCRDCKHLIGRICEIDHHDKAGFQNCEEYDGRVTTGNDK